MAENTVSGILTGVGHRVTGKRSSKNANRRLRRRGAPKGWEFVRVCVDNATRPAYIEVLGDERAQSAVGFPRRAVRFFAPHGVRVEGVMTDNGSAYRSTVHAIACRALGIRLKRPHGALGRKTPGARLRELNDPLGSYISATPKTERRPGPVGCKDVQPSLYTPYA